MQNTLDDYGLVDTYRCMDQALGASCQAMVWRGAVSARLAGRVTCMGHQWTVKECVFFANNMAYVIAVRGT